MNVDKLDWRWGQVSQTSTYENTISKSSAFLANALKQKQKSSSQPTHIAPKINCCPENRWYAIWGFCSPQQPQQQNLSPEFSGKVNNQFCFWLSTQNKTWLEGRKEVVILPEIVRSSGMVYLIGGWEVQFSKEPLEILKSKQLDVEHWKSLSFWLICFNWQFPYLQKFFSNFID